MPFPVAGCEAVRGCASFRHRRPELTNRLPVLASVVLPEFGEEPRGAQRPHADILCRLLTNPHTDCLTGHTVVSCGAELPTETKKLVNVVLQPGVELHVPKRVLILCRGMGGHTTPLTASGHPRRVEVGGVLQHGLGKVLEFMADHPSRFFHLPLDHPRVSPIRGGHEQPK